jgi:lauroyl/myristoyl acyltransferase
VKAKDEASYLAYTAGWSVVRKLPEKSAYRSFDVIADRLWRRHGGGVTQLEKNLQRVEPDASYSQLREMSRESMRKYFRYWCDAFRLPDWDRERIVGTFECSGEYRLDQGLAQNKGAIIALAHMGSWDHAGAWIRLTKGPVTAVAEKLEPERLFEKFLAYREALGIQIYPTGTPNIIDTLARELTEDKQIIALVSDRDLTARGIEVRFFDVATRMPAGPANLALLTGAPIFPATLWYEGPTACAQIHPQVVVPSSAPTGDDAKNQPGYDTAVKAITQQIADAFQNGIADRPTDWHMLQKLWLPDLDPDRLAASDSAGNRDGEQRR